MKPFMEQIECPVLSANIKPDQTLAPTFGSSYLPYKILTVGSERVGVVGYTSQETPALSKPGKWKWTYMSLFASNAVSQSLHAHLRASTL